MAAEQHPRGYRDRPCELCEEAEAAAERRGFKTGLWSMVPALAVACCASSLATAYCAESARREHDPPPVLAEKAFTPETKRECSALAKVEKKTTAMRVYVERAYVDHETDEIILVVLCP